MRRILLACCFVFFSSFTMEAKDPIKAGTYQITEIDGFPEDVGLVLERAGFVPSEYVSLVMVSDTSHGELVILIGKLPTVWYTVDSVDGNYLLRYDFDPPIHSSSLPVHKKFKVAVQKDANGLLALQITDADDQHKLSHPVKIYLKYVSSSQQLTF